MAAVHKRYVSLSGTLPPGVLADYVEDNAGDWVLGRGENLPRVLAALREVQRVMDSPEPK